MTQSPKSYHHGSLVEAMVAATVDLIEERGAENVSVREAAKRAGVSAGAPFRHFKSKTALMTAVAEQSMRRLVDAIEAGLSESGLDDPVAAYRALARSYLRWAIDNPTHFRVISSRTLIDFFSSDMLVGENARLRQVMRDILSRAQAQGLLAATADLDLVLLNSRAFGYGLARMSVDGHFAEWHPGEPPEQAVTRALDLYISQMFLAR